jgi:hypothetical protein
MGGMEDPRRTAYWESFGCMMLGLVIVGVVTLAIPAIFYAVFYNSPLSR